MKYKKVRDKF